MFELTKRADYGLAFLAVLAQKGRDERLTLTELGVLGYPQAFMAKIAKDLVDAGVISAKEGRRGGYSLNYPADQVEVRDALEALEGEIEPVTCGGCSARGGCSQRGFMDKLERRMEKALDGYTLADLVK